MNIFFTFVIGKKDIFFFFFVFFGGVVDGDRKVSAQVQEESLFLILIFEVQDTDCDDFCFRVSEWMD